MARRAFLIMVIFLSVCCIVRSASEKHDPFFGIGHLDGIKCVKDCLGHIYDVIQETDNDQLFSKALTNQTAIQRLCGEFQSSKVCAKDRCEDDPIRKMYMAGMAGLRFMCTDGFESFQDRMPCFRKTLGAVQRSCDEQCGDQQYVNEQMRQMLVAASELKLQRANNALDRMTSRRTQCKHQCTRSIMKAKCGTHEASDLLWKYIVLTSGANKQGHQLTPRCQQIVDGDMGSSSGRSVAGKPPLFLMMLLVTVFYVLSY